MPVKKQNYAGPSHDDLLEEVIASLALARETVERLVEVRKRDKLSFTRASNVAREIGDLIKVVSAHRNPKTE